MLLVAQRLLGELRLLAPTAVKLSMDGLLRQTAREM